MENGLFLCQQRYATNLLLKANMSDCKPESTPMALKLQVPDESPPFKDSSLNGGIVGLLVVHFNI